MLDKIKKLYKKYDEIVNYLIVGALTTLITLLSYYFFVSTFLNPNIAFQLQIANVLSWIIGVSFAYVTNRIFVFKSKNKNIKSELFKFFSSRISTLLFDMLFMCLFVTIFGFNDKIMKIISNIFIIVLNYILSKLFVFNRKK